MISDPVPCSTCGAPGDGDFCSACGSSRGTIRCPGCGAVALPGAKFCVTCGGVLIMHRGEAENHSGPGNWTRWIGSVAMAVLAVTAVIWAATRGAPAIGTGSGGLDRGDLPPRQRFAQVADRAETMLQSGDTAAVARVFPLVERAYAALSTTDRDIDARFHVGILRAQVGHAANASSAADSILALAPGHLLGLYLKAIVADYQGNVVAARAARSRFRAQFDSELAKPRPEYQAHRTLLNRFLATTPQP